MRKSIFLCDLAVVRRQGKRMSFGVCVMLQLKLQPMSGAAEAEEGL